jgi:nucleotide-binding universal stress UspA family protein
MAYSKALVPVSGKYRLERAARALGQALEIVAPDGGICFLHCLEEMTHISPPGRDAAQKKLIMGNPGEAKTLLRPLAERAERAGMRVDMHIVGTAVEEAVPRVAVEERCDVVVMFVDGLPKLAPGSIGERVLQKLAVPLLLVH